MSDNQKPPLLADTPEVPHLPDRSALSQLYPTAGGQAERQLKANLERPVTNTPSLRITAWLVAAWLFAPMSTTYLLVLFLLSQSADPLAPMQRFFFAIFCILIWKGALKKLRQQFADSDITFGIFFVIYLFYMLPIVKISYDILPKTPLGIVATLALWLVAHLAIVGYITWVCNRSEAGKQRAVRLAVPVVVVALVAALV